MSADTLPAAGYVSDPSRTTLEIQSTSETSISVIKELIGAAPEGPTLSIASNIISPANNACVFPVDATGGGVVDLINVSNIRDGQGLYLHCVSSSNPITITNLATGSGSNVPIATFSGANVVLSNPAFFISLKYSAALNVFQEIFSSANWASPGAIGSTAPNSGAFTTISLTTALSITNGGTGATTAAGARTNLGVAASGANSDITSLTGLTTALALGEGGTGATAAGAARTNLGAAASGANSDITSLTGLTTAIAIGSGGTGATTAATARANLGAAASGANSDITSLTGLTTAIGIGSGGTGATSAAGARANLGAAASGANSDITSLTGLTTPLVLAEGGTGSSTAAGARTNLAAAASGANSDITSLSGLTTPLSLSQGGTGLSAIGTANQLLAVNSAGTALTYVTGGSGSASFPLANQCRLYGVSASSTPANCYADTPSSGNQTLYFGPCCDKGNSIFLHSSGAWSRVACSEISLSLASLTSGDIYDVYAYNNGGTVALETDVWSGSTPSAKTTQDGVLVKSTDSTRLYVGTVEIFTNSSSQLSVASWAGYRGIWNAYNRIQGTVSAVDTTSSWAGTSSWRIARGVSAGLSSYGVAGIRIITGLQIESIQLQRFCTAEPDSYSDSALFGINVDQSTTPYVVAEGTVFATSYTSAGVVTSAVSYAANQVGGHTYYNYEAVSGGANFFGASTWSSTYGYRSGMYGTTWF